MKNKIYIILFTPIVVSIFILFFNGPLKQNKIITIPYGSSVSTIGDILYSNGILYNKYTFLIYSRIFGFDDLFVHGDFNINKYINLYSLVNYLTQDKNIISYKITLIEGYTIKQAIDIINNESKLTGEITIHVQEGQLMPDTYFFRKGDTRNSIVLRMKNSMENYLNDKWNNATNKLIYKNKEEALIMASLVEKESTLAQERPIIASVFLNRLKIGMPLQTDPTIAYALGKENADKLTKDDLRVNSPYNTYKNYGLTPTPIANPSRGAIDAAFNPSITKYLYFVADGKGGHIFSTNLVDHNKSVANWRQIEKNIRKQQLLK